MRRRYQPGRMPTPEEVRAARSAAGLTQTQAAAVLYITTSGWQKYETASDMQNNRPMPAALFELFLLKCGFLTLHEARATREVGL
jgi:putative transcriptional regulator